MSFWDRVKSGIQIVVGGHSQGRVIVKGVTHNSGSQAPKQGEAWLHAYNTMPWLRANVSKIAGGVASLEWGITRTMDDNGMTVKRADVQKGSPDYRRKALAALEEEGKAEAVFDHPFLTLWKNPCPALPGNSARKLAQVYYETVGEVFFVVDRGPRDAWIKSDFTGRPLPTALWPVPPTWVKRFPTPDNPTFEIRHSGLQLNDVPMSEVLWLKDPDPVNPYGRGVGLFNSLSDELDSDENAARMISYSFYNRNRPDVLVSLPGADDRELQSFRNNWISNLQGVQNVLKSHFVNVEANVEQIGYDFREMQVIDLRKHTRDTIRQVPGMPPEMLGIQDQSNRSTIEAAEFIFNKHVVEPRAETWREFLGSQVLVEYDPRAVLDYVSPVQEDKAFTLQVATGRPEVIRVNEVRKLGGLPALTEAEGGKLFFVNGAFTPTLAAAPAPGGMPGGAPGTPGDGSGLSTPGFEGGINVPGAPQMHLSVPGAAGSPESGIPFEGPPTLPPGGAPPPPGAPPPAPVPPVADKDPFATAKGVTKALRGRADLSPDQADVIAKWAKMSGYDLDLDLVRKTVPLPLSDRRPEEAARRILAHLGGFPTKAWDPMFGAWGEADDAVLDTLLTGKGYEEQPRDEAGRFAPLAGASLAAGRGAAREGRDRRVDGDGAHVVRAKLDAIAPKHRLMTSEQAARFAERVRAARLHTGDAVQAAEAKVADAETRLAIARAKTREATERVEAARARIAVRQAAATMRGDNDKRYDGKSLPKIPARHLDPNPEPEVPGESDREARQRLARNAARAGRKAPHIEIVVKGDVDGHPFRGNQWTEGQGGGDSQDGKDRSPAADESSPGPSVTHSPAASIIAEERTQPEGEAFDPDVEKDGDGDGVTDSARVGVPADEVPPPPRVPRLPNLTPEERAVEESFAKAYEADPDKLAADFEKMILADGSPAKFEADAAKNLFGPWKGEGLSPEERAEVRSTMNTALHQTADAIAKRAFLAHLDKLPDDMKAKGLLVTVGGCGAGKGFALKTLAKEGFTDFNAKNYGVVWDSAGDQNATENPWLLAECEKRGIPVTYAYVSSDPEVAWADPQRGVVQRAMDPKDGRMVDAKVFADSYVQGAKNHAAFHAANADKARFVFVKNGAKIEKLDGVPESDTSRSRRRLHDFAVSTVAKLGDKVPPRIRRGALIGQRIWPRGRHDQRRRKP